ncbi:hypothetical protein Glove_262g76 [Diversispora epigaea]|uniref:Uncharacterized protein n=1 Tax=Diversispora epigaea TaxID=1348612 RepID=A0A397I5U5_9GLOM|nr:hypothetical protein Glove_262g76 [Diversispora epigaea]
MYDATKHTSHTGKLEPKWKGPFYIHNRLTQGVYKLRTLNGKVLLAPINGSLFKMYHEGSTWKSQIYLIRIGSYTLRPITQPYTLGDS